MDTLGLLLIVVVTAASLSDQAGARKIFQQMRGPCKKLRKVWVDGTYRGAEWTAWVKEQYKIVLESVARAAGQKGFAVLPHRWVVERKRLRRVTASLGRGKNIGLVEPMSSIEQRLRRVTDHK